MTGPGDPRQQGPEDDATRQVHLPPVPRTRPVQQPPVQQPPVQQPPVQQPPGESTQEIRLGPPPQQPAPQQPAWQQPPAWQQQPGWQPYAQPHQQPYGPPPQQSWQPPGAWAPPAGQPPPRRGRAVALGAGGAVLLAVVALVVVLALRGGGSDGTTAAPATTSSPGSAGATSPSGPAPGGDFGGGASAAPPPSGSSAAPHDAGSADLALRFVQELADQDATTARGQLCRSGQDRFAGPADLQRDFESFVGGRLVSGRLGYAVGASSGEDYVRFDATLDDGSSASFAIVVVPESSGLTVCGWVQPGDVP